MATLYPTKESIKHQLDYWDAKATAIENRLHQTQAEALKTLSKVNKNTQKRLNDFKKLLSKKRTLAQKSKLDLLNKVDKLQTQLTEKQSDFVKSFSKTRGGVSKNIHDLKNAIISNFTKKQNAFNKSVITALEALDAEIDSFEAAVEARTGQQNEILEAQKHEIEEQVHQFKKIIEEKRHQTFGKISDFNEELTSGFQQILSAVSHLVH